NTVLSMQQAVRDGAMAVEFDVQLTRDMVPVIYHDWNVAETGLDVPVNSLTLKQFMSYGPQSKSLARTRSHSNIDSLGQSLALHANSNDTVRAPFATLEDLFESLPESVGFDIEIKYPMPDEADEAGIDTNFEMNQFVDRILDIVFKHTPSLPKQSLAEFSDDERPERRPIVFTSFHPDICLLLAHKIDGEFPIMFLTDAGRTTMADARCNSLVAAVRLCRRMGLAGIVTYAAPIVESPRVAHMVRRNNLALATYGRQNNRREMVLIQKSAGVDIVITDKVRLAAAAVQTA
ncbi:Glycerophosphocholine phosphodiesterase, partial [Linderina pennispora]